LYKTLKVKIYKYRYFKRQLKTPTCFGFFGIHPQGVLKVLHWNYLWSNFNTPWGWIPKNPKHVGVFNCLLKYW